MVLPCRPLKSLILLLLLFVLSDSGQPRINHLVVLQFLIWLNKLNYVAHNHTKREKDRNDNKKVRNKRDEEVGKGVCRTHTE